MSRAKKALVVAALLIAAGGWYLFRPERAFIDTRVADAPAPINAVVVARGEFKPLAHEGRGTASVMRQADGSYVVRLSDFATLNGPDVRVYLLGAPSVRGRDELKAAGFVDLGPLKGNIGDQHYIVPAGTDVSRALAVSVWCRRFGVNFTAAVLDRVDDER